MERSVAVLLFQVLKFDPFPNKSAKSLECKPYGCRVGEFTKEFRKLSG
uniref:Uncharacterized protein n=1 Tax=Anopheles atroparvus TaxID=41427 RepID=A0AAG5D0L6_ANOAO